MRPDKQKQMMSYLTRPATAQRERVGFRDGMKDMEEKLVRNYKTEVLKELETGKKPSEIQSYENYLKTQTKVDMNPGKKKLTEALDKATKIRLAKIGCPGKANGGRIGFNEGVNVAACATKGIEKLKGDPNNLTSGDQANLRAISKSTKAARFLKNILGPGAIVGEVLIEGGIAANKFLDQGLPIKLALGESYINKYLLGPKTKINLEAERAKEFAKGEDFAMAQRGRRMMIPQSATADKQRLKKREEEMKALYPQLQDANLSNKEIDKSLKDIGVSSPFTLGFGMQQIQPGIGDMRYNEEQAYNDIRNFINQKIDKDIQSQQMQTIADAGGVANLSEGGVASGPPPKSGPNPQGLLSLKNRVRNL